MEKQAITRQKKTLIALLYAVAIAIILLGAALSVYSLLNDVQYSVLSSSVPGFVFGLVILFLGVRYVLSLQKLKAEVNRTTSGFDWGNFEKPKKSKA